MRADFSDVLSTLRGLGAERVLVLEGPKPFKLRASFGIQEGEPWDQQISLSLLDQTVSKGTPLLLGDAQTVAQPSWSMLMNSVRSVLCVPFWSPSSRIAGVLYADTRSKAGVFSAKAMEAVQICARRLEASLYGGPRAEAPVKVQVAPSGSLGLRQPARSRPVAAPAPVAPPTPSRHRPRAHAVTIFLRSLATMSGAGVPLTRSLDVLALHEEDPGLRAVLQDVCHRVHGGTPLSAAMRAHPRAFPVLYVQMFAVGERTGAMHQVQTRVADHREKLQESQLRLRQALSYPACVMGLCFLLLVFGLPYMLAGQFDLIRGSGQPIPAITRFVMGLAELARNPLWWLGVAAVVALAVRTLDWSRLPGLRRVHSQLLASRFAATLAVAYQVGLPVQEALRLATPGALQADGEAMITLIKGGATLSECLRRSTLLPPLLAQLVAAGEESGRLTVFLEWTANFYELELNQSLERFLAVLEPLVLLVIGILVGFVLLATLLPMVSVMQHL